LFYGIIWVQENKPTRPKTEIAKNCLLEARDFQPDLLGFPRSGFSHVIYGVESFERIDIGRFNVLAKSFSE
jgi:hypothetical protein